MKKLFALLLVCCVLLGLAACADVQISDETVATTMAEPDGYAFPENTVLCGIDVGGMSIEAAYNAITARTAAYGLRLTVNDQSLAFTAEEMGFAFNEEAFAAFCAAAKEGDPEQPEDLITYDAAYVQDAAMAALEPKAVDAAIVFSQEEDKFVLVPDVDGADVDIQSVMAAVDDAVLSLCGEVNINVDAEILRPKITADDPGIVAALKAANAYLRAVPAYVYTLDRGETVTEQLSNETVATFVRIGADWSVTVDEAAVQNYALQMGQAYSSEARSGDFVTTGGGTVALTVDYSGRCVDTAALAADISQCLASSTGGVRDVPYTVQTNVALLPFDGNYVEVDLSGQQLWVYKDGECVVTTPLVSGCVADGKFTPNGVYAIYEKDRDCWLTGPTWNDFVEYWMAFYKGFGIHDASWRSEFGGDIYMYEGSHGCPNLPPEMADDVYYNAPLGTKVILYGGETVAEQLTQVLTGTTLYELPMGTEPFKLDVTPKYKGAEFVYRSSNPQVASVASDGTVTIEGPGSAVITVVAAGFTFHSGASMPVQIQVNP